MLSNVGLIKEPEEPLQRWREGVSTSRTVARWKCVRFNQTNLSGGGSDQRASISDKIKNDKADWMGRKGPARELRRRAFKRHSLIFPHALRLWMAVVVPLITLNSKCTVQAISERYSTVLCARPSGSWRLWDFRVVWGTLTVLFWERMDKQIIIFCIGRSYLLPGKRRIACCRHSRSNFGWTLCFENEFRSKFKLGVAVPAGLD